MWEKTSASKKKTISQKSIQKYTTRKTIGSSVFFAASSTSARLSPNGFGLIKTTFCTELACGI